MEAEGDSDLLLRKMKMPTSDWLHVKAEGNLKRVVATSAANSAVHDRGATKLSRASAMGSP